jgi:hypothetical protein
VLAQHLHQQQQQDEVFNSQTSELAMVAAAAATAARADELLARLASHCATMHADVSSASFVW